MAQTSVLNPPVLGVAVSAAERSVSRVAFRRVWLWVLPLLLLSCWLGARGLNMDAIWNDEFYSIHDAGGPPYGPLTPAGIWERVSTRNVWHTPGYFIALNEWGSLVGWTPPMLRAFSLLAGLLGIAWTYRLGAELVSAKAGFYAAAILSVSAFFIHYMHELRMYTLFVLLAAFTIWVYLRIVRGRPRLLHWVGLFLGALGMLYTHYFSTLPVVAIGLYHVWLLVRALWQRRKLAGESATPNPRLSEKSVSPVKGRGNLLDSLAAQGASVAQILKAWIRVPLVLGLAFVCFLPWLRYLLKALGKAADSEYLHERALTAGETMEYLLRLFGNGSVVVMLIALAIALYGLRTRSGRRVWFLAVACVGAVLVANALLEIMHEGRVRYLISTWPLLAVLIGFGLAHLGERPALRIPAAALLALWVAFGVAQSINPLFAKGMDGYDPFPMHEIAQDLRPVAAPDDVLVSYVPDGSPFWVYDRNEDITHFYFNGVPMNFTTARKMVDPNMQPDELQDTLDTVGNSLRLWLAYQPGRPDAEMPALLDALDDTYAQCGVPFDQPDLRIELYASTPICCGPVADNPPMIDYDGGEIDLSAIDPLPAQVGDTLSVVQAWSIASSVPPYKYSVAMHIVDSDGNLVAQSDQGLPLIAFSCSRTTIDTSALAPGAYTLHIIVYAWEDGARLAGTMATGEQGDSLVLGTFEKE